jgi:hypothetical protein
MLSEKSREEIWLNRAIAPKFEIRISKFETTAPTVFKVGAGHGKFEFSNVQMTKNFCLTDS